MSEERKNIRWQKISRKYYHERRTLTFEHFSAETDPFFVDNFHVTLGGLETLYGLQFDPLDGFATPVGYHRGYTDVQKFQSFNQL